jgi:DNA-binding winged helix-turn-helix (wHTH) protein
MSMLTFGPFRLENRTLELWRDGQPVPIRPQPCRLLALLVSRAGALVTREEITATLWPGVHVRFDLGLNSCLKQIRAALGDDAERPRWIETLSRRGYRFMGTVRKDDHGPMSSIRRLLVLPASAVHPSDDRVLPLLPALSAELEAVLSRLNPALAVVPSGSLSECASTGSSLRTLAAAGIDLVLECRVDCEGPKFRVSAQLVDAPEQVIAWADIFDGVIEDRFATQRAVSHGIAAAVREVLGFERRHEWRDDPCACA